MKGILLSTLLLGFTAITFAQKPDSIWVTISRLQVNGIVVDHNNEPVKNIQVKTLLAQKSTSTDNTGRFYLPEIRENDVIYVEKDNGLTWENVDGSRFIKLKIKLPKEYNLNESKRFEIKAKRITEKAKYKVKDGYPLLMHMDILIHRYMRAA